MTAVMVELTDPDELVAVAEAVEKGAVVSVLAPIPLLSAADPDVLTRLDTVDWIRAGFDRAPFGLLPDSVIDLVLSTERQAYASMGLEPGALAVDDWWDPRLIEAAVRHEIPALVLPANRCVTGGTIHRFHHTRTVLARDRDLTVLPVQRLATLGPGDHTVRAMLASATGGVRAEIGPIGPEPLDPQPGTASIHRLLNRTIARLPEHPTPQLAESLASALAGAGYGPHATPSMRETTIRRLLDVRIAIETAKRRSAGWTRARRIDWYSDGAEELELESADLLAVVDPAGSTIPFLATKSEPWPVSELAGEAGWLLCRHTTPSDTVLRVTSEVRSMEEARDRLTVELAGAIGDGTVELTITVEERVIALDYRLAGVPPGRFGPELGLALPGATLRTDGGDWQEVTEPMAVAGHRFRMATADDRSVLVGSMMPAEMFARPADDGVIAHPHWLTSGDGRYRLEVRL